MAPRRYWSAWETYLPVPQATIASAVATAATGCLTGFEGFLSYAQRANAVVAGAILSSPSAPTESDLMAYGPTAFLAFLFFTPLGWLSLYLVASGAARAVGAVTDAPFGDPALTLIDWVVRHQRRERRARHERQTREEAEGPVVADLVVLPAALNMRGSDVIVVAARRKQGWERDAFVVDGEVTYRIGSPVDRHYPVGLRRLYPLTRETSIEALRRWVRYELPAVGSADSLFVAPRIEPSEADADR
jgi:hypothetical protein